MDYLVRDEGNDQHAIIPADSPVDAMQGYIGIIKKVQPKRDVNPFDLITYPITGKNIILEPAIIEPDSENADF